MAMQQITRWYPFIPKSVIVFLNQDPLQIGMLFMVFKWAFGGLNWQKMMWTIPQSDAPQVSRDPDKKHQELWERPFLRCWVGLSVSSAHAPLWVCLEIPSGKLT